MNNKEAEIEKVELSLLLRDIVHATIEEPECVYLSYDGKDAKLDDGNTEGYHKLKLQEIGTRIEFNFAPHVDSQRCFAFGYIAATMIVKDRETTSIGYL